ncbi:MAG: beta-galactosidase, partial [Verrucomicrobiae bacterium]|nr:beta-galactosidase [Verrucomicrobiae bacterium]
MITNRREFLKSVTAAGAATYLANHQPLAAQSLSKMDVFNQLPDIPWGAVYFRKSNPDYEHWEGDYRQAVKDGMNTFRHWFMWSAIEVAPGKYDWADYDAQFELAAKHGIKTVIGEMLGTAPLWAFRKWPHARVASSDDTPHYPHYTPASAVGGWPGLCLDNDEVKDQAEKFLIAMVRRYKDHPGMGAY